MRSSAGAVAVQRQAKYNNVMQPLRSLLIVADATSIPDRCIADAIVGDIALAPTVPSRQFFAEIPGESEQALRTIIRSKPAGVVLRGCRAGADIQRLDVLLSVAEAEEGVELGTTHIIGMTDGVLPPPNSEAAFKQKSRRLAGLLWDWRLLAKFLGARRSKDADGRWTQAFAEARTATLMCAKAAGIAAYEFASDVADLDRVCREARADGFDGRATETPGDIVTINSTFSAHD